LPEHVLQPVCGPERLLHPLAPLAYLQTEQQAPAEPITSTALRNWVRREALTSVAPGVMPLQAGAAGTVLGHTLLNTVLISSNLSRRLSMWILRMGVAPAVMTESSPLSVQAAAEKP